MSVVTARSRVILFLFPFRLFLRMKRKGGTRAISKAKKKEGRSIGKIVEEFLLYVLVKAVSSLFSFPIPLEKKAKGIRFNI